MQVGIAGYKSSGKTSVFNCLTGSSASTGPGGARELNRGVIKVPDERIDKLSAIFSPKKTTYADISFVDLPGVGDGSGSDGLDAKTGAELRNMDALVHVLRGFSAESGGLGPRKDKVDALRDLLDFEIELALADLVVIDSRVSRLDKEGKKTREQDLLQKLRAEMDDGEKPVRTLTVDEATQTFVQNFQLLSKKPQLALLNLADDDSPSAAAEAEAKLREAGAPRGIAVMSLRANIEREIAELPPEEQQSFLGDLGLTETARARFIRSCYSMLDLISFFTVGEDEVRAWTIKKGTPAVRAAGKIHSDLERGFIRAEVVSYDDFIPLGKLAKAREAGKLRLEGKDYVVADGDIINVRFAV